METANKLIYSSTKFFTENGEEYRITVTISLDDDCHNNMCDWSVTADIRHKNRDRRGQKNVAGCVTVAPGRSVQAWPGRGRRRQQVENKPVRKRYADCWMSSYCV